MHCWKVIHVEREYGKVRLAIFNIMVFVLVFCFSYIMMSFRYTDMHTDHYFWVNIIITPLIYPLHKLIHYFALFGYKKTLTVKLKIHFKSLPIIRMRLRDLIPKKRYIFALIAPFLVITFIILVIGYYYPQFAHYLSFYLAFHSSICIIDFLYVKNLVSAPNNAIIEETPKGYEILVPPKNK